MIYHFLVNICCFYHWNSFALFCAVDLVDSVDSVFAVVAAAAAALGAAFIVVAAIVANTNASVVTCFIGTEVSILLASSVLGVQNILINMSYKLGLLNYPYAVSNETND